MFFLLIVWSLIILGNSVVADPQPVVVVPSAFVWDSENEIIVTVRPKHVGDQQPVDVRVHIDGSEPKFGPFRMGKAAVRPGEPISLKTRLSGSAEYYRVRVSAGGHSDFVVNVRGVPSLKTVFIQTDRTFYKPNETVSVRSLPISYDGSIYKRKVEYILKVITDHWLKTLKDPNGFQIRKLISKSGDDFDSLEFSLPPFVRFGKWEIAAVPHHPENFNSDRILGNVYFHVEDYVLPKFNVMIRISDGEQQFDVSVLVLAKYPGGSHVNGDLILRCSLQSDDEFTRKPIQLSKGIIQNGQWNNQIDLRQCYPTETDQNTKLRLDVEVRDAETFRSEWGTTSYELLKPGFEVIPSRPAVSPQTKQIILFIRPLSNSSAIQSSEVVVNFICVSGDKSRNGFQRTHSGHRMGVFLSLAFDVHPNCVVHLFKIYRKLSGDRLSREETIALPTLRTESALQLFWIEPSDPTKVLFHEGDLFEAHVAVRDSHFIVLCNDQITSSGSISSTGKLSFPIESGMSGICSVFVYSLSDGIPRLDEWLFVAESSACPQKFGVSLSKSKIAVNEEMGIQLKGNGDSLALIRGIDSRLHRMMENSDELKRNRVFGFGEFGGNFNLSTETSVLLNGFFDSKSFLDEFVDICALGGLYVPTQLNYSAGSSMVSNLCLKKMIAVNRDREGHQSSTGRGNLNDMVSQKLSLASVFGAPRHEPQQNPFAIVNARVPANEATDEEPEADWTPFVRDEVFLRDFFPIVWLFKSFRFGENGTLEETLKAPHSIGEWTFDSHFWSPHRSAICRLPTLNVLTTRNVFIDVDVPQHIYENETTQIRVTVTAENLQNPEMLSLCIEGFSPVVCVDMGPRGKADITDYSSVVLEPGRRSVEKSYFVRFLRIGLYDLHFELRQRSNLPGGKYSCSDKSVYVYDRVRQQIRVSRRVDVDEHFRQMVIYRQRSTAELSDVSKTVSNPDVIQFENEPFGNGTVATRVTLTPVSKVFDISMEFSEFVPQLPMIDVQRLAEMHPRTRRSLMSTRVFSELLTFSDCRIPSKACGFGEYGPPSSPYSRDAVLTALATALLCEQNALPQFVSGPIYHLSQVIRNPQQTRSPFLEMLQFVGGDRQKTSFQANRNDSVTFLLSLLSWTGRECAMYESVSGDVLLNSLGLLAFVSHRESYTFWKGRLDFDALANWLIGQQNSDQQYENALDTYFGLKALYTYRSLQLPLLRGQTIVANISSSEEFIRQLNGNDLPLALSIPSNSTLLTVNSMGDLRMIMGVRVLSEKRRRPKRDPSESFPVSIQITQKREGDSRLFVQKVTIQSHSSMLTTLELEHRLLSGFNANPESIRLEGKSVDFLIPPRVSSSAIHFVLNGVERDENIVYEVRLGGPDSIALDYLAPMLITVRQHNIVVGRRVVFADELDFSYPAESRRRRSALMNRLSEESKLIETVCVDSGACTCAEATCDVQCSNCSSVPVEELCREFSRPNGFAAIFRLDEHREVELDGSDYDVFDVRLFEWFGTSEIREKFTLWIRTCNRFCRRMTREQKGRFLLIGSADGIFHSAVDHGNNLTDTSLLQKHYLLRNGDRLAKASDCWATFSQFQESECLGEH